MCRSREPVNRIVGPASAPASAARQACVLQAGCGVGVRRLDDPGRAVRIHGQGWRASGVPVLAERDGYGLVSCAVHAAEAPQEGGVAQRVQHHLPGLGPAARLRLAALQQAKGVRRQVQAAAQRHADGRAPDHGVGYALRCAESGVFISEAVAQRL